MRALAADPASVLRLPYADGHAVRRGFLAGIARVLAERDALDRINVFPVADGDTGTNLGFTLAAVRDALRSWHSAHAGRVLARAAGEAIDGARGNSGAILAQFLQGLREPLEDEATLTPSTLAAAATHAAAQARLAVAEPREGTLLSVIDAFATALRGAVDAGVVDLGVGLAGAHAAARDALDRTPDQLAVLRKAGVVDAGARGFVLLVEGVLDLLRRGRIALRGAGRGMAASAGVVAASPEAASPERWCTECIVSGVHVDREAVRTALSGVAGSSLVVAGTREKLRVHMHVDDPAMLFDALAAFGQVGSRKADDMHAQQRSATATRGVAVVIDSAADIPAAAFDDLPLHMVPVRVNAGPHDYLDKVSLSPAAFHALVASSPHPVRTSQPPVGDFRRLFEFLLSHHDDVVYVGLSRALSGTLQAGESAASVHAARVRVVDTGNVSGGQGLLALHAAERAAAGDGAEAIAEALRDLRERTATFCYVRDLSPAVRGGRIPAWALPITRWLRLVPFVRIGGGDGRLHIRGVLFDRGDVPERFVARAIRSLDAKQRWRAQIMHCDNPAEAGRVRAVLLARWPHLAALEVLDAGSAIAAHAGRGAVALSLMPVDARP
ncbi:DegV family protein [Dokdonella sp. MW10]|uniref:DegV family protein n=1 Tax=Dokdonella sp. MW10 TaxID=2992926 RepID=UPI003F7F334E